MKRIGLVGIGFIGVIHARAIVASNKLELAAICGADTERDRVAAAEFVCPYYTDVAEMVADPTIDIVDVCTPTFMHEEHVVMAAKAGKNVICEKPFGLSIASVDHMMASCKENGVLLMIAQVVRFMEESRLLRSYLTENRLGCVRTAFFRRMSSNAGRVLRKVKWYDDPNFSGGALFDLILHDLDLAYSLFGEVDQVYCIGQQTELGCWDELFASVNFKCGARVMLESSSYMPEKYPFTTAFRVCGEKGCLEYAAGSATNQGASMGQAQMRWYPRKGEAEDIAFDACDSYQAELEYFADCVEKGVQPALVPPEQSREVIRIVFALKESLESGQPIILDVEKGSAVQ